MTKQLSASDAKKISEKLRLFGVIVVILSVLLVLAGLMCPINTDTQPTSWQKAGDFEPLSVVGPDLGPLFAKMAGRRLIKPSQIKAAVKNTGAAARLLKKLKLQGIVQMGGNSIAYIKVEKKGVKSIRQGDKLLEFVVTKVKSNHVVLELDGVEVELRI